MAARHLGLPVKSPRLCGRPKTRPVPNDASATAWRSWVAAPCQAAGPWA